MTRAQRKALRGRELAVWAAVFAAEWHRSFDSNRDTNGIDVALVEFDFAETALHVADEAVVQMRRWECENGAVSDRVDVEMRRERRRR